MRAISERDWAALEALCAPGFTEHDHRKLAVLGTTAGADAWHQSHRAITDLSPDATVRLDHLASSGNPTTPVGLDEEATFVSMDVGSHHDDAVDRAAVQAAGHDRYSSSIDE